jgi:2-keto-4-pentenoate hydratase
MTAIITSEIRDAAARLQRAQADRVPCAPVRDLLPDKEIATGYVVQTVLTEERLAGGARIVGRKIGLTSPAVQQQLGVDQPDFGVLFQDMQCTPDEPIEHSRLLQPRIEAEIAFVLAEDLAGPIDEQAARAAVGHMVAALEIVDSRIAGWDITIVDTIADNASSGLFVLGTERVPLGEHDLRSAEMRMIDHTGAVVSEGSGAACLGDPITALTWLARTAQQFGAPLRAGDIVLSGALGPMVSVPAGAAYSADIIGVGSVRASFTWPGRCRAVVSSVVTTSGMLEWQ